MGRDNLGFLSSEVALKGFRQKKLNGKRKTGFILIAKTKLKPRSFHKTSASRIPILMLKVSNNKIIGTQ